MEHRSGELAELRRTLASLADQLAEASAAVERLSGQADGGSDREFMTPPRPAQGSAAAGPGPVAPPAWPVPPGAVTAHPGFPPPGFPPPAHPAFPPPAASGVPGPDRADGSWADTSGQKILGWVGGGVTLLGVVMLLVVAAQQGYFGPLARVIAGFVLAALLVAAGLWLHRRPDRDTLAVTVVATGLGVGYLTTVGAVRLVELFPALVGHLLAAAIVALAVAIARQWQRHLLATVSFAVAALAAPIVAGDYSWDVYLFVAIMVAGGAVLFLHGLGVAVWLGAAGAAAVTIFIGLSASPVTPTILWLVLMTGLAVWAVFLGRLHTGRAPVDPGPFPIRPRATDPEQVARDYADFHDHQLRIDLARADRAVATASLTAAAALMALALAMAQPAGTRDLAVGLIAAALMLLAGATAWSVGRDHPPIRVVAYLATILFAVIALLRLLDGDIRSISWMVLATVVLIIIGVERARGTLVASLGLAVVAVLAASPALGPADLVEWPATGLVADGALVPRGWTVVLPAGIGVLALTLAAWWATARVTAARLDQLAVDLAAGTAAPGSDLAAARRERTAIMAWMLICCAIVACYGLLAVTMVLSYAAAPTLTGYQVGQIIVTIFVTLAALVLLWQGFRTMLLRLGGLGLAAVAVSKLLLFDTRALESIPRAVTVIAVGVLLLVGATIYLRALSRVHSATVAGSEPVEAGPQA